MIVYLVKGSEAGSTWSGDNSWLVKATTNQEHAKRFAENKNDARLPQQKKHNLVKYYVEELQVEE